MIDVPVVPGINNDMTMLISEERVTERNQYEKLKTIESLITI